MAQTIGVAIGYERAPSRTAGRVLASSCCPGVASRWQADRSGFRRFH